MRLINCLITLVVVVVLTHAAVWVVRELAHGPTVAQTEQDVADDLQDALAVDADAYHNGQQFGGTLSLNRQVSGEAKALLS